MTFLGEGDRPGEGVLPGFAQVSILTSLVFLAMLSWFVFLLLSVGGLGTDLSKSVDHSLVFLDNQIQNEDSMLVWPSFFAAENANLLQKPKRFKQVVTDLEQ